MIKDLLESSSSPSDIVSNLIESSVFRKSYHVSETEFEVLRNILRRSSPNLQIKDSGVSTYGFEKGAKEAIFRFDREQLTMHADVSLRQLKKLNI